MQKILSYICFLLTCVSWPIFAATDGSFSSPKDTTPLLIFNSESFSATQGLTQNTVTSVVEDNNGFIWIGTLNGLNRFDGSEFKKFHSNENNGLVSDFIQSLEIFNGKLFIGTDSGLQEMDFETEKFSSSAQFKKPVTYLKKHEEQLIIGSLKSINILNNNAEIVYSKVDAKLDFIKQAIVYGNEILVRNHDGHLLKIDMNNDRVDNISDNVVAIGLIENHLYVNKQDGTFDYKDDILYKINENKYDAITYGRDQLITLSENLIRITYKNRMDSGIINTDRSLISPIIFALSNGFLIASTNNGFMLFSDSGNILKTMHYQKESNIWSIDRNNNKLIITDESSSIKIYDTDLHLQETIETVSSGFKAAAVISDDEIAYCNSDGIYLYNLNSKLNRKISDIQAFSMSYSQSDNMLILGTSDHEVRTLNIHSGIDNLVFATNNPIFQVKIKKEGDIYISHQGGLSVINYISGNKENYLNDYIVYGVSFNDDKVYAATEKGVYEFANKTAIVKELYSTNKPVYSIGIHNNVIYASSINEIIIITPEKSYLLHSGNGSQSEYNNQSIGFFNDGVIFGGIQGLSILNNSEFNALTKTANHRLNTNLTGLYVFNDEIKVGNSILEKTIDSSNEVFLKYSDYPFAIQFSSPRLYNKNITHVYRLQGLSDEWVVAKKTKMATYTNLSPGSYIFEVYAKDNLSQQIGPSKKIKITITPPWWTSAEAKFIYGIILIVFFAFTIKAVLRRREVQRQIAISEERLKLSLWGSGDEMWDWDIEAGKIYRSNIWGSLEFPKDGHRSGHQDEDSNIHPQDQARVKEALRQHFEGVTDHFEVAYRVKGKEDQWIWILDRAKIVERDDADKALRMTGTIKNINNFKHAEEQLRLFERAIQNISEGMFILDNEFRFVEVNEACCDLSQISKEIFIGTELHFSCYPDDYSDQVRMLLRQQGSWSGEVESRRGDNSTFLMEITVDAIYDEQGSLSHFVGVFSDISRRKQQEEELRKLTNSDLLTGLPNRSNLQVSLNNLVKKDIHHTLMVLDLDNFKRINDSLGHQVGDALLILVSERMSDVLPTHTSLYRLGGDEFAILVDKDSDIGASAAIAKTLVEAFIAPFELAGEKLVVGISIGIVLYPEDEQNEQALLRKADIAMYHAKSAGGNRYQFYSESLNRNALRQLEVENLIRDGLRDDLFEVYYQPKIDLRTSRMAGMEALVRLNHPTKGLISPAEFIPLAEETGLIVDIGDVVMRKACFAAQKWRQQGLFNGRVAVNLSSRQFALPDLQQRIESILRLTRLPAANLELEITEGTVIKQPEKAIKVMQQLAKMGVSLALDDFGTGYSSLSYLKRFPIHTLKIDKAFVDDIDKSDRDLKMVDSIITIAHNMGLTVVGEGVEEASQLNILKALKCEEIQGFIFSKAIPEAEFTSLLAKEFASHKEMKIQFANNF